MATSKLNKKASLGTAVFSAVSLKLCCWGPLLLTGVAGISGSSVYFSWLVAIKPYLLIIAILSLSFAFYQIYKRNNVKECGTCDPHRLPFFQSKLYVWLVAAFVVVMTLLSYYPQLLLQNKGNEFMIVNLTDIASVKLEIIGMVCESCETNINHSVTKIDGVTQVNTSFEKGMSLIEFDTTKTSITEIKEVIESKGYIIKTTNNE